MAARFADAADVMGGSGCDCGTLEDMCESVARRDVLEADYSE